MATFKQLYESPWSGAMLAVLGAVWEGFWLIGPPVGMGIADRKPYLVWGLVALMVCFFQSFYAFYRRNAELSLRLQKIDEAKPRIKLKLPEAVHSRLVGHVFFYPGSNQIKSTHTVPFLRVAIHNDPSDSFPHSVAKGVRAFIEFIPGGKESSILTMDGRWAETDQPPEYSPFKSKTSLLETSLGFGESRNLDIAYISGIDGKCYAWNNDNYEYYAAHQYVMPEHLLPETIYRVRVRLRGEFIDEAFEFEFKVVPGGFEFTQPVQLGSAA